MKNKLFLYGYRPAVRLTNNKILNVFLDPIVSMIRGIYNIIDGLVLILSLGRIFPGLGFKAVVFIMKQVKTKKE